MPKYFFHMREGDSFVEDTEGVELPDTAAVRAEAIRAAREIMAERVLAGKVIDGQEFLIFDDHGRQITAIPFKSALHIE